MKKILSFFVILFVLGCHQYQSVDPDQVTMAEIQLKGEFGERVRTLVHFSVPPNYHPQKSFPLVIALHGSGSSSAAFHDLWKSATDSCSCVLLTVQGEHKMHDGMGWTWGRNADQSILVAMQVLQEHINIDFKKVYVAGFSSGGRLAYYMGLSHSNLFHGIAALSAQFESEFVPKFMLNQQQVYIAHGTLETELAQHSVAAKAAFEKLGAHVYYTKFPDIGHTIPEPKVNTLMEIINFLQNKESKGE